MRTEQMGRVLLAILIAVSGTLVQAESSDRPPMELRQIMQGMGKGMQEIAGAIAREDWSSVATQAPFIGRHPQPSMGERLRILGYFAAESGQFKRYDDETHEAAMRLQASALQRDGETVIDDFAQLQKRCLACHRHYRQAFVEHFYDND